MNGMDTRTARDVARGFLMAAAAATTTAVALVIAAISAVVVALCALAVCYIVAVGLAGIIASITGASGL